MPDIVVDLDYGISVEKLWEYHGCGPCRWLARYGLFGLIIHGCKFHGVLSVLFGGCSRFGPNCSLNVYKDCGFIWLNSGVKFKVRQTDLEG